MRSNLDFSRAHRVQVPGVPALAEATKALAVDFDGTLTKSADSTAALLAAAAALAPDAAARQGEIKSLVSGFLTRKAAHDEAMQGLTPPKAMEARHAFEATSYQPLAHALRGATRAALSDVGKTLPLRAGAMRTLGLARARALPVHVITLNPSEDCVRGALRISGPTDAHGACCGIVLHATSLGFGSDGACSGSFGASVLASGADKASAFTKAGLAATAAAYVGDSVSDLPAMMLARLPIAIGTDAALRSTAVAMGLKVLPLAAASIALASPSGLPPPGSTLYDAGESWEAIAAVLLPPPVHPPPPAGPAGGTGVPRVLIVAGSDSGGGAGIQADLKACEANGAFGMTAVTALTAQNTKGVQGVEAPPLSFVELQMGSVLDDIGADAVKTGMLPSPDLAALVASRAVTSGVVHGRALVVDPVLVTSSGALLVPPEDVSPIARWLFPLAEVVTPNLPEAACLLGYESSQSILSLEEMHSAARRLHALGPRWVLLKGGHLESSDESVDVLYGGEDEVYELRAPRVKTGNTHGTGCTLASTVAALLARGHGAQRAAALAKVYLHGALSATAPLSIGTGAHGPLHHSYATHPWPPPPPTAKAPSSSSPARPPLDLGVYVITDAKLNAKHARSVGDAVRAAIRGGATIVQLREKDVPGKELLAAAIEAVAAAKGSGVPVLINDRVDIALASGAAGAHLGQEDLDVTTARKILGPAAIIGATAKTPELAKRAVAMGADYIGSGAVYETSTKSSSCIGLEGLSAVCAAIHPVPVVGIGGIGHENARAVVEAGGAQGVAVVSAVFDAKDVQAATEALLQVMCAAKAARA